MKTFAEKCWDGYTQRGMKKKGGRMVPNCVPVSKEESLPPHLAKHFDKKGNAIKGEWKDGKWSAKKKQSDFKMTDVTPKGYGPTDEESNIERLRKQLAIHKFKKSGGEIEKQPEGDAYNAMKWRGKTHSTRDEDDENERARKVMAYRKMLRDKKRAKKK